MKKLMFFAFSAFVTTGLFSCHKNSEKVQPKKTHSAARVITQSYANPDNPYDYIGALHNQGCDFFVQNGVNKDNFASTALDLGQRFVNSQNMEGAEAVTTILQSSQVTSLLGVAGQNTYTGEQELQNMMDQHAITDQQYQYLSQMNALLDAIPQIGEQNNNDVAQTYAVVHDRFVAIENDIIANVSDANQQKTLLAAAAVDRYSTGYWMEQASDPNSPFAGALPSALTVGGVVKADGNGAATASVGWGIYAAWVGGAVGWGATVVAGGVVGSLGKILDGL